jgi:hypothetical protein
VAKKAAVSVGDLVRTALLKVAGATSEVKFIGKDGGLFVTAAGANKQAIAECLTAEKPLVAVVRTEGKAQFVALAPAGFERIASELPDDQVGTVARGIARALPPSARIEFIQGAIRRTPLAAAELTPLLEEAVAAEKAEHETRVAAAERRRNGEEAAKRALERAIQLFEERRQNRLATLRREWEVEGGRVGDLPVHSPQTKKQEPEPRGNARPEPTTDDEKEFRRDVVHQLAAAWRAAWDSKKHEARDYLESAMWNISGLRLIGEPDQQVAYNGREHDSLPGVGAGDPVRIVRPGWALDEPAGSFVVLKAVIAQQG